MDHYVDAADVAAYMDDTWQPTWMTRSSLRWWHVAAYVDDGVATYVGVDFLLLSHLLLPINDFGKRLISSPKSFQQIKI
jgi:hypothetical protein